MRLQDLRTYRPKLSPLAYGVGKRLIQGFTLAQVRRAMQLSETDLRTLRDEIRAVSGELIKPKEYSGKGDVMVPIAARCKVCRMLEPHECLSAAGRGAAEGWTW